MKRRDLVILLAGGALWPVGAVAQPRMARVGYLMFDTPPEPFATYFRQGLREFGYVEGKNLQLDIRLAANRKALDEAAADLVRQKVQVIATVRTPATEAAKRATRDIPIVITLVADAVALGLVTSLSRPGGNVTGVSVNTALMAAKSLEKMREAMPGLRSVAALSDGDSTFSRLFQQRVEATAKVLGLELHALSVKGADGIGAALPALRKLRPDAVIFQPSLGPSVAKVVLKERIAPVSPNGALAEECLLTYSADIPDMFRRAAGYVDRVLKGTRPADMPVEEPSKFEFTVNLRIAQALGIAIPRALLAHADRVIR